MPDSMLTPSDILCAAMLINLWTFLLFGIDKRRARRAAWRISEGTLLFWALVGGSAGAYAGRATFRHKTRKQPFVGQLHGIALFQAFAAAVGAGWYLG